MLGRFRSLLRAFRSRRDFETGSLRSCVSTSSSAPTIWYAPASQRQKRDAGPLWNWADSTV